MADEFRNNLKGEDIENIAELNVSFAKHPTKPRSVSDALEHLDANKSSTDHLHNLADIATPRGQWDGTGVRYNRGNIVWYKGGMWICLQSHGSNKDYKPWDSSTNIWSEWHGELNLIHGGTDATPGAGTDNTLIIIRNFNGAPTAGQLDRGEICLDRLNTNMYVSYDGATSNRITDGNFSTATVKTKAGAFTGGELAIGELGLDTNAPALYCSKDGTTVFLV